MTEILERFCKYIAPEPNSGCWLWTGCWDGRGYGSFSLYVAVTAS